MEFVRRKIEIVSDKLTSSTRPTPTKYPKKDREGLFGTGRERDEDGVTPGFRGTVVLEFLVPNF